MLPAAPLGFGKRAADCIAAALVKLVGVTPGCVGLGSAVIDILGCCEFFCDFDPVG